MPLNFALAALEPRSLNRTAQCDLTRPGCSRCAKLGKICPGYREESDLLFRNANIVSYAKGLAVCRRKNEGEAESVGSLDDKGLSWQTPGATPRSLSHPVGRDVLGVPRDLHSGGCPAILSDGGGTIDSLLSASDIPRTRGC